MTTITMPAWSEPLWTPKRYKVLYGGRGSGKSWAVATHLVIEMARQPLRVLCAREFQKSIKESAHKLLSDRISSLKLDSLFEVGESFIRSKVGGEAIFLGLRHNISQIKSLEGIDRAWVEEAQTISQDSWDTLIPTIRKPGSEFLVTFNPENEDDATHQMFISQQQPDSWVRKVNYDENPWFPKELEFERANLHASGDKDKYAHIWLGECRRSMAGAIYGEQMAAAKEQGRITQVPYTPACPVMTSWDLGYSDATAIWFYQLVGKEPRFIDYHENRQMPLDYYVDYVRQKPYKYSMHVMPHDAGHQSLRTGKTLAKQAEEMGLGEIGKTLTVLPQDSVEAGIELTRQLIHQAWYDAEKCADGIKALTKYHYEFDEERQIYRPKPHHDWSSNGADSKRYAATYIATRRAPVAYKGQSGYPQGQQNQQGWMG